MSVRKRFWGMRHAGRRRWLAEVGATALACGAAGVARAAEPSTHELLDKVKELQAKVERLETRSPEREAQSRAVDATINSMLKDADKRSQFLAAEGFTAGYSDGKFLLKSADGNFVLHPYFQFQFSSKTNYRQDAKQNGTADDYQNGFEVRRLKFGFDGNVFTPDLTYLFQWATDRKDGIPKLEAAQVQYKLAGTPLSLKAGQFKEALDHEQITSTKYTAAVDRTFINDIFANGEGYIQGVSLVYDNSNNLRGELTFSDGMKSVNTNFQDFPTNTTDWGRNGRVEYKLFGNWKDYDRLAAYGTKAETLVVGAAVDYTEAGDTGTITYVADAQYNNPNGLGAYAAFLGRYIKNPVLGSAAVSDTNDITLRGQVSYVIDQKWEPFIQYEYVHFDAHGLAAGLENEVHIIRAGTSYFLSGQNARIQVDVSYLPNGSPVADDASGVLVISGKNELILRAQLQLLL